MKYDELSTIGFMIWDTLFSDCACNKVLVPSVVPIFNALFCLSVVSIFVFIEMLFFFSCLLYGKC